MKTDALKKLRNHSIVNCFDKDYPFRPSINTTEHHIQIYNLVDEYICLHEDYQKVTAPTTKRYISDRMKEIEGELTNFWIVPDKEMITPKK